MSEIQSYFENKTILLTGATGFLGKLLLEKLLRSCSKLNKIYVIIREKKGLQTQERLNQIFDIPAYDKLKLQDPKFYEKIIVVDGDLESPYLGLSEENISELQEKVEVVFHCGATVRFDETLRRVGIINIRGTKHLIEICRSAKRLESFVYVSTAFSNCYKNHVNEMIYEPYIKPEVFMSMINNFDDDTLEKMAPILLKDLPNTYILSKGSIESLLLQEGRDLPISIVRPSIVISSFKEPIEGWTDNYYAATGLFVAVGLGLLRSILGDKKNKADLIPVDFVVNNIIAVAWDTHRRSKGNNLTIFTCASGNRNPITWDGFCAKITEHGLKYPPTKSVWYPFGYFIKSKILHYLCMFFLHTIPAIFIDFISILLLKKPFMLKITKKMNKFVNAISYFTYREWKFNDDNTKRLYDSLSEIDKELFPFDVGMMRWDDYFDGYIKGVRLYLLKDPIETVPAGKRKYKILCVVHYVSMAILMYLLYMFISFTLKILL